MILLYPNYTKKSRQQSRILPQAQHKHRHIIPDPAPTAAYGIRKYLLCDLLRILFFQCLYHIPHPLLAIILQCIQHTVRHHDQQIARCQLPHPTSVCAFWKIPSGRLSPPIHSVPPLSFRKVAAPPTLQISHSPLYRSRLQISTVG